MGGSKQKSQKNEWDDTALIDSWNEAVQEYERYYSIKQSGKRLEDVLTAKELRELRKDHSDVLEDRATSDAEISDEFMEVDDADAKNEKDEAVVTGQSPNQTEVRELAKTQESRQEGMKETNGVTAESHSVLQALKATVQDESLRNLMMSWYYAGYYTGLHAGAQQAIASQAKDTEEEKT